VVAVIGVLLGSGFTPDMIAQAGDWAVSLGILAVYCVAVALVVVPFYRFAGRMDWVTAYFAGMPGGLTEMIEIGEANGARPVPVILAHSLRIVVTIAAIAFWFRYVQGHAVGAAPLGPAAHLGPLDATLLLASAVLGSGLGLRLGWPAPTFLGPLFLSALLHLSGLTASAPPGLVVILAQICLGTVLGCRFSGISARVLAPALGLCVGATGLTLGLALLAASAMRGLVGTDLETGLLALSPGGMTEMGLIALAIKADVALVTLHHVMRILFVIVLAPLAFRLGFRHRVRG